MQDNITPSSYKKIIRKSLWILVCLCILVGGIIGYVYFSMTQTANQFMQSIFQEDIQTAYNFIVPDLQQQIPYDSFEKAIKSAYSDNAPDIPIRWEEYTMHYKIGYISGIYETMKGTPVQVEIELIRQGIDWKVSYFKSR